MREWSVQLPVTGYVIVNVEAETAEEAINKALDSDDIKREDIEEWEVHRQTNRGNIAYGSCTEANAEPC